MRNKEIVLKENFNEVDAIRLSIETCCDIIEWGRDNKSLVKKHMTDIGEFTIQLIRKVAVYIYTIVTNNLLIFHFCAPDGRVFAILKEAIFDIDTGVFIAEPLWIDHDYLKSIGLKGDSQFFSFGCFLAAAAIAFTSCCSRKLMKKNEMIERPTSIKRYKTIYYFDKDVGITT